MYHCGLFFISIIFICISFLRVNECVFLFVFIFIFILAYFFLLFCVFVIPFIQINSSFISNITHTHMHRLLCECVVVNSSIDHIDTPFSFSKEIASISSIYRYIHSLIISSGGGGSSSIIIPFDQFGGDFHRLT